MPPLGLYNNLKNKTMFLNLNIVMLVVILIVVIPFVWFIWADKMAVNKKKKAIQKIAQTQEVNISDVEYWNNSCLAYDVQNNILLYINIGDFDTTVQKFRLDDVRKCSINKINKDYKSGDQHYSELARLELEFSFVSNASPVIITLYDVNDNFSQNQEMGRAEKWLGLINQHKFSTQNVSVA